jgi:hypothetical protein
VHNINKKIKFNMLFSIVVTLVLLKKLNDCQNNNFTYTNELNSDVHEYDPRAVQNNMWLLNCNTMQYSSYIIKKDQQINNVYDIEVVVVFDFERVEDKRITKNDVRCMIKTLR